MARPILIAGAGIAGACAAYELARRHAGPVHVFEAEQPAAGASGAAAGLVNPLMGRRANPVWRLREAVDAVHDLLDKIGRPDLLTPGVFRPTVEPDQVSDFEDAAAAYPDIAEWLPAETFHDRLPDIRTCGGGLFIARGGAVDVSALVRAVLSAARSHGAEVHTDSRVLYWSENDGLVHVDVEHSVEKDSSVETYRGEHLVLCVGQGYPQIAELSNLRLKGIKGQTVRVRRPPETGDGPLHPLSGRGYIVPAADGTLILGSSYTHNFDALDPDPEETTYILSKTAEMLPGLEQAEVLNVTSGVRVKHPDSNLPIVGPLPDRERIWTFTALGSKGLLTAPVIAGELYEYLRDPAIIPNDLAVPSLFGPS